MKALSIALSLSFATLLIGAMTSGAFTSQTKLGQSEEQKLIKQEGETIIKYFVRKAKTQGLTKIVIPEPEVRLAAIPRNLDEALSRFSIVIGRPLQKTSLVNEDGYGISTFYKMKIIEVLSKSDKKFCCENLIKIPGQLAEPMAGEIYLASSGGTVTVDGIELTQREWTDELSIDHNYLLFLSQNISEKVNTVDLGREVLYKIDSDGMIDTNFKEPNSITNQIRSEYGNSISSLKNSIKSK